MCIKLIATESFILHYNLTEIFLFSCGYVNSINKVDDSKPDLYDGRTAAPVPGTVKLDGDSYYSDTGSQGNI